MSAVKTANEFVLKNTGTQAQKSAGIQDAIQRSRSQKPEVRSLNDEDGGGAEMGADSVASRRQRPTGETKQESPVITPKDVTILDGEGNLTDAASEVSSMPDEMPSSGLPTGGPAVAESYGAASPDALASQVGVDSVPSSGVAAATPYQGSELREPTAISPEIGGRLTAEDPGALS